MDKNTEPISVSEAAEILGVTPRHISRLLTKGELTAVYKFAGIRGAYLLSRSEVLARAEVNRDA